MRVNGTLPVDLKYTLPLRWLRYDDRLDYWVYIDGKGKRTRANDLSWQGPEPKREKPEYEPYPLHYLTQMLRCSSVDAVALIGRWGPIYRKRDAADEWVDNNIEAALGNVDTQPAGTKKPSGSS